MVVRNDDGSYSIPLKVVRTLTELAHAAEEEKITIGLIIDIGSISADVLSKLDGIGTP